MHINGKKDKANITDEELARRAAAGDDEAVNLLIYRFAGAVHNRAAGYCGGELSPEDLAQEGMIGLICAIKSYSPDKGTSFKTFAMLCIDTSIISAVRSTLKKSSVPKSVTVSFDDENAVSVGRDEGGDFVMSAEEAVLANETKSAVERNMRELLSDSERKVLTLRLGGCGYDDIAERMGISVKSVDGILYRVRKKLRGSM